MATADKADETVKTSVPTIGWKDGGPMIPWRHNGERSFSTLFMRMHYGCWVRGFRWHPSEKAIKVYIEARGEFDLRHPKTTTFTITRPTKNGLATSLKFPRGKWVSEQNKEEWGLYRGYLELPDSFFGGAAGCSWVMRFADLSHLGIQDYQPLVLATFPESSGEDSVLGDLFFGSSETIGGHSSPVVRRQSSPDASPFPDGELSAQREKWQEVFPADVLDRHFVP